MAEEIDVEKCNSPNVRSPVTLTLTLDQVKVKLVYISGRGLPTYHIRLKSEKLFCGWTDVHTNGHTEFQSISRCPAMT